MDAIAEMFVGVITAFLHLCLWLVRATLGAGFLAARRTGLSRTGYMLICLSSAYLSFGLLRWFVPGFDSPTLYGLYTTGVFIGFIALFFVGLVCVGAARTPLPTQQQSDGRLIDSVEGESKAGIIFVGLVLIFGIVLSVTSAVGTTRHQSSLRDLVCTEYEERVSDGLRATASNARDLAERLIGRQIAPDISCSDD